MFTSCILTVLLTLLSPLSPAQSSSGTLSNETIIKMVIAGVPTATLVKTIEAADKVDFRFLPSDLAALSQANVPDEVVKAMAARDKGSATPHMASVGAVGPPSNPSPVKQTVSKTVPQPGKLETPAETFKDVKYLHKVGGKDKGEEIGGKLDIDSAAKKITFQSKDSVVEIQAENITGLLYERTSRPRYASGLLLAWPLLFTKGKKHYLTIQYTESGEGKYAIFHLDKGDYREILAATEATTGKRVDRSEEQ